MLKPVTLIVRQKYSYKKQIKTDYETQFPTDPMLNDKIEKKSIKKTQKTTWVNPLSTIPGSWDQNNLMKSKQNKSWS